MADIVRLFDSAINAAQDRLKRRGQLGRINSSGSPTVEVPGSGGRLVYVRLGASGADGDIMAVPRGVPKRAHVYVLCHQRDGQWVAELDTSAVNQNGAGSNAAPPHTHRRHSGLEYVVEAEMFAPGVVLSAGGLTVSIGRFRYPNSGNGETYEGGTLDLTSHVPATAGKWRWVLVGVDPDTNAAVAVSGSDFDTQAELTLAEIDNVTFTGDIPLAAIQVANGDTALTDHSRYYDARPWFVPADDGAIPSHDHQDAAGGGQLDHGLALTGLADDDHTQYVLLAGRVGGQTGYGGTGDGDALTLAGSSHANGGPVLLQPDGGNVGIGTNTLDSNIRLTLSQPSFVLQAWRVGSANANFRDWAMNVGGNTVGGFDFMVGNSAGDAPYGTGKEVLTMTKERRIGIRKLSPLAQLHVDQPSTTGAIPVLILDQADLSEEFINFVAPVGAGNPVDTAALGSYYGKIRVSVNGTFRYIPLYSS